MNCTLIIRIVAVNYTRWRDALDYPFIVALLMVVYMVLFLKQA